RDEEKGSWAATQGWRPLPEAVAALREVRIARWVLIGAGLGLGIVMPFLVTNSAAVILTEIISFAIVGLSVGIVTGLGGQLSLGQFAIGAVGAVVSFDVTSHGGNFALAFIYAGLAAAAVSLLLGLPALRARGLMLTLTTLALALIAPARLLQ